MTRSAISRREFLEAASALGFGAFVASATRAWALDAIDNPLARYPSRDWERVYRDLWKYDSTFTFLCAPNDTHNCILNAYVRSGVVTRIGPSWARSSIASSSVFPATVSFASTRTWRGLACGADGSATYGSLTPPPSPAPRPRPGRRS